MGSQAYLKNQPLQANIDFCSLLCKQVEKGILSTVFHMSVQFAMNAPKRSTHLLMLFLGFISYLQMCPFAAVRDCPYGEKYVSFCC